MGIPPMTRELYKRLLVAGRDYPLGTTWLRDKIKAEMRKNAGLDPASNETEYKRAIAAGRYWARELEAVAKVRKYRAMKSGNYYGSEP